MVDPRHPLVVLKFPERELRGQEAKPQLKPVRLRVRRGNRLRQQFSVVEGQSLIAAGLLHRSPASNHVALEACDDRLGRPGRKSAPWATNMTDKGRYHSL
jgi:hypothetical protein